MTVVKTLSELKYNEKVFTEGAKIDISDQTIVDHLIEIGAVEEADSSAVQDTQPTE